LFRGKAVPPPATGGKTAVVVADTKSVCKSARRQLEPAVASTVPKVKVRRRRQDNESAGANSRGTTDIPSLLARTYDVAPPAKAGCRHRERLPPTFARFIAL
jgi:hypothetical protein